MSLNAEAWSPIEVAEWIAGLETNGNGLLPGESGGRSSNFLGFAHYSANFLQQNVTGRLLLNLMAGDLQRYGVNKIGDQLLLQEAIQSLRSEFDTPRVTLQSLASTLAVRCRNYRSELSLLSTAKTQNSSSSINYIPTESLSSASYLLDSSKTLIRWLTRFPFLGHVEYDEITVKLTKHCFELAMLSQRDSFADNAIEEVQYLCTKIIEICEGIIHSKDSLIIQPAAVDVITLRKRTEQDLGLHLESSYFGLHQVSGVKLSSPAQQSGHLEKGDEILQVNYQTVVGWPQQNVVNLLHENSNEVILTIKRRPRHATANILAHMYLRPNNKLMGSSHRSNKRHSRHGHSADKGQNQLQISSPSSLHLPSHHHHQKSMPISPVPEDENSSSSTTSSSGNSPVVLLNVSVSNTISNTGDSAGHTPSDRETPNLKNPKHLGEDLVDQDSTDTDQNKSPEVGSLLDRDSDSNSTSNSTNKSPNSSSANSRFWKLYPRPRNLIRRRATVTGASPTSTRPPVTFFDDENTDSKLRPPLINSKSAPEKIRVGLRKQGHVSTEGTQTQQQNRATMPPVLDFMAHFDDHSQSQLASSGISKDDKSIVNSKSLSVNMIKSKTDSTEDPKSTLASSVSTSTSACIPTPVVTSTEDSAAGASNGSKTNDLTPKAHAEIAERKRANSPEMQSHPLPAGPKSEPTILLKGILHLRQSPSNLLVKSNSLTSTSSSHPQGPGFSLSAHPRWTRHPSFLDSSKLLQIGSDPEGCLRLNVSEESGCEVSLATEVHSRPFAFKIDMKNNKIQTQIRNAGGPEEKSSGIVYLAAESQAEFEMWMKQLMKPGGSETLSLSRSGSGAKELMYHRMRNSAPPLYKRSISLGNSPAYSRRGSVLSQSQPGSWGVGAGNTGNSPTSSATQVRESSSQESINQGQSGQNRSQLVRKHSLIRSSRLVGTSTPNVQSSSSSYSSCPIGTSKPYQSPQSSGASSLTRKISNNESVKSEWFNSPVTPTTSPRRFFSTSGSGNNPVSARSPPNPNLPSSVMKLSSSSPNALAGAVDLNKRVHTSITGSSGSNSSNISSITIRSVARKSESDSLSNPRSHSNSDSVPLSPEELRLKNRSASGSKLPSMGVSMMLAKQNQSQTELPMAQGSAVSPKKSCSSSTSTSSSSDVFIKADNPNTESERRRARRVINCPSCGGSTSSFSKSDKSAGLVAVRDMWTQTLTHSQQGDESERCGPNAPLAPPQSVSSVSGPTSPNLELLRHLINEQEGSRV